MSKLMFESIQAMPDRYRIVRCDHCGGDGELMANLDDVKQYNRLYNSRFRSAMRVYRMWQHTKTVPCPYCDGRGIWEERV